MFKKILGVLALSLLPLTAQAQVTYTYSAGLGVETATAAGTGPFFTICGSSTREMTVKEFTLNGSVGTAAVRGTVVLTKTSTATSAGTATALTKVPHNSFAAAATASNVSYYTALATTGSAVGVVASRMKNFPITATMAATDVIPEIVIPLDIPLHGVAECLQASFGATTSNAPTLKVTVTWLEVKG